MLQELTYAYEIEYCSYLEKPTAELTWDEQGLECAHPFTSCAGCEHCQHHKKQGTVLHNPAELAF